MIPRQAHLTSGHTEYDNGFEYYTFEVAFSGFEALSKATDPMHILVGWYTRNPRPAASEVVGIHDTKLNVVDKTVVITLKIQRGHYTASNFLMDHYLHACKVYSCDDGCCITMHCITCDKYTQIYKDSIPGYKRASINPDLDPVPIGLPVGPETPDRAF